MLRNYSLCGEPDCQICYPTPQVYAQKEQQMYTTLNVQAAPVIEKKDEAQQYALRRLECIYDDKRDQLKEDFEINGIRPKTVGEMKKWLKEGNYRFDTPTGTDDDLELDYWREYFAWGKEGPDTEAWEKALLALRNAKQAAADVIRIRTDEQARLDAVKTFADWTQ